MKLFSSIRALRALLLLIGSVLSAAAFGADDIVIGNEKWEQLERIPLANGDVMFRARPKKVSQPEAKADAVSATPIVAAAKAESKAPAQTSASAEAATTDKPKTNTIADQFTDIINQETQLADSSGLTLLGVTATDINRPTSPRDFATAVARGVDSSGKVKTGVAVEISPFSLFSPKSIVGGDQYVNSAWMQAKARTSVALATAKSDDSKIGSQVAASIRVGLIDDGDPRLTWGLLDSCVRDAMATVPIPVDPRKNIDKEPDGQDAAMKAAKVCYKKAMEKGHDLWLQPSWYAGYAKAWYTGSSGQFQGAKPNANVLWTSYSQGWYYQDSDMKGLYQLYASRKRGELVQDAADTNKLNSEDRTDLIARLRFGKKKWNGFVDAGVARVNTAGVLSNNVRRIGYGAEYQMGENLWLVVGSVTERGYVSGDSKRTLLNTGIRFGESGKSILSPVPAPVPSKAEAN